MTILAKRMFANIYPLEMKDHLMSFAKKIGIAATILSLSTGVAFARSATDEETAAFKTAVTDYTNAMSSNDVEKIINFLPPKLYQTLGEMAGKDPATLKTEMTASMSQASKGMQFSDIKIDFDKVTPGELTDGEPYFVVPVSATMNANHSKMKFDNEFIAVLDDGKWYFVTSTNPQQLSVLSKAFPGLEKVKVEAPKVSPIK